MLDLVMMALGSFRFGMAGAGYQRLQHSARFRGEALDRVGRAPAMQFLGPAAAEISLEGVIYPHFKGGLRQVEQMRLIAGTGTPMMMVDGLGWIWDRWCILSVAETKSVFLADGAPRMIEFSVGLSAYGSDVA